MTGAKAAPVPPSGRAAAAGDLPLTRRDIVVVIYALMSALLLAALDQTIVGTALPTIVGALHRTSSSWAVTAYLLASTASAPLWGKLGDLYGRRRFFQAAIVIFIVGLMACGAAQNMSQLVLFRGLQGIGGGGLMSLAFAIVADAMLPLVAGIVAASVVSGRIISRTGRYRRFPIAGAAATAVAALALAQVGPLRRRRRVGPAQLKALAGSVRHAVVAAYATGIDHIFSAAAAVLVAAFVLALTLRLKPLQRALASEGPTASAHPAGSRRRATGPRT